MKKYSFLIDGITVTVFPASAYCNGREAILPHLREDEIAALLIPDSRADFIADFFDRNNREPREPNICLSALFCFFKDVRCYPHMQIEICYKGALYMLDINSNSDYKFSVNIGKYKVISKENFKFADGIEVEYYLIGGACPIAVIVCNDSDLFDEAVLSRILMSEKRNGCLSALAVSCSDKFRIKEVGKSYPSEAIAAGLFALSRKGVQIHRDVCEAYINGKKLDFAYSVPILDFYPELKYLY